MLATFEKRERLRHIGHLDILRAMQRALRRSGLPAAYSQGFNPHILLTFASALSVGASGECEIMEVTLTEEVTPEAFLAAMNKALPPELPLTGARVLEDRHPAAMALVKAARYRIVPLEHMEQLAAALPGYLSQEEIQAERKTKSGVKPCDIRPLIYELEAREDGLHCLLALTETESCKPNMLMETLCAYAGVPVPRLRLIRVGLLGQDAQGQLVPLETL